MNKKGNFCDWMRKDINNKRHYVRPELDEVFIDSIVSLDGASYPEDAGGGDDVFGTTSASSVTTTLSTQSTLMTDEDAFGGNSPDY